MFRAWRQSGCFDGFCKTDLCIKRVLSDRCGKTRTCVGYEYDQNKIAELTEEYVALKKAGVTEVDSVSINGEKEVELQQGGTTQLEVTVLPENVLNNTVTWSTDNPAVAVVKDGAVTAKGSGRAVITVTSNQNEEKKDSVTIVVKEAEVEEGAQVSYYSFDDVKGQKLEDEWENVTVLLMLPAQPKPANQEKR